MTVTCPSCKKEIDDSVNFCPNCGQEFILEKKALSPVKKRRIYLASFFLSPLGLIWFFKYFRSDEKENKKVAYIALVLTLLPLIFTLIVSKKYISVMSTTMGTYKDNMGVYSELGL